MSLLASLKTVYHLTVKPVRGVDHAARMESFYAGQADGYDAFRQRLLRGREELFASLPAPDGGVWVDLGGGTGFNFECLGPRLNALGKAYVVDLCPSLLEVARARVERRGWTNVVPTLADATTFRPAEGQADVVTFSYALTMIPDWFAAIENACAMLRPGGYIGVVDFYISRKYPAGGHSRHGAPTRWLWPAWFAHDNVFLSSDHVPYLHYRFRRESFVEARATVPFLPWLRVPYYRFIGRKPTETTRVPAC